MIQSYTVIGHDDIIGDWNRIDTVSYTHLYGYGKKYGYGYGYGYGYEAKNKKS